MESLQRTANRGSISTGYDVDNSVKFDDGNNTTTVEFFERNVSSAGSRTTATFSAWLKRTQLDANQYIFTFGNVDNDNGRTFARFQEDDTLRIGGGQTVWLNTNRVFRDTSAWYHIVVAIDTTSGTADNRIRLYVNGEEVTQFGTRNNPSQNDVMGTNFGKQAIGYNTVDNGNGFNGYMCEVVIQDGVASAPTEFGKFDSASGIWIPKDASGATMGTNGSYLKFENASSMGAAMTKQLTLALIIFVLGLLYGFMQLIEQYFKEQQILKVLQLGVVVKVLLGLQTVNGIGRIKHQATIQL